MCEIYIHTGTRKLANHLHRPPIHLWRLRSLVDNEDVRCLFGRRAFGVQLPVDGLAELVRRRVQPRLPVEDGILNGGRWIAVVDHEAAVVLGAAQHDRIELSIRWNDARKVVPDPFPVGVDVVGAADDVRELRS